MFLHNVNIANYQTLSRRMTNCTYTLMPSWFYKLCYFSALRVLRPIVHHKGLNRGDWGWICIRLGLRRPRHTQGLRNSWPAVGKRATLETSDYKPQNIRLPAELCFISLISIVYKITYQNRTCNWTLESRSFRQARGTRLEAKAGLHTGHTIQPEWYHVYSVTNFPVQGKNVHWSTTNS